MRKRWALTVNQAALLIQHLPLKARAMVSVALTTGVRRGELFALRWANLNEDERSIPIREAVYRGRFDEPKTETSVRVVPLADDLIHLLAQWKGKTRKTRPDDLIFGTRN